MDKTISVLSACLTGAECVPTFGAEPDLCRGWPEGGLEGLHCPWDPQRWTHPETRGGNSWLEFEGSILPTIDDRDTLLVISGDKEGRAARLIDRLGGRGALYVLACGDRIPGGALRSVRLADTGVVNRQHQLAVVRSALGRLSTSAFAEGGALYENLMVDLRITNRKLFDRAARLVALLAGLSEKEASGCVTRVVTGRRGGAPATQEEVDAVILAAAGAAPGHPKSDFALEISAVANGEGGAVCCRAACPEASSSAPAMIRRPRFPIGGRI